MITLVLGGARSGKSAVAGRLAAALGPDVTYVATAVFDARDEDFTRRIEAHQARRPPAWTTIEAGPELTAIMGTLEGPVLVDSLGTWVAACADPYGPPADHTALCEALAGRAGDTVVVSEEVGLGVHPSSEAGRHFRDILGTVNQAVANVADDVLLVVAGRVLPLSRA